MFVSGKTYLGCTEFAGLYDRFYIQSACYCIYSQCIFNSNVIRSTVIQNM